MEDFKGNKLSEAKLFFVFNLLLENKKRKDLEYVLTNPKKDGTLWTGDDVLNVLEICQYDHDSLSGNLWMELLSLRLDGGYWKSEELSLLNEIKHAFTDFYSLVKPINGIYLNACDLQKILDALADDLDAELFLDSLIEEKRKTIC